jgi:threonine dehydrogenase-like Zn-dependent dehydrogenase
VQALVFESGREKVREIPRPRPRRGFALVEVIASGITGSPRGMPRALRLVKPRGTIVWKSTHHAPARFDAAPLVVNEVTVVGSRCGRFEPALALLASGAVKVRPLLAAEFPLAHARAALREAARPGVLKVLLRPGGAA